MCFISIYSVLNKFSEYIHCHISKNITSHAFLFIFEIAESFQFVLKGFTENLSVYYVFSSLKCLIMMRPSCTSKKCSKKHSMFNLDTLYTDRKKALDKTARKNKGIYN